MKKNSDDDNVIPIRKILSKVVDSLDAPTPEIHYQKKAAASSRGRIPSVGRWYEPGQFKPWNIDRDTSFSNFTRAQRQIYLYICRRSRPTLKKPCRRYISISIVEISRELDLSDRTVRGTIKILISLRFLIRWHRGYPDTGSSRYEIPASIAQIRLWRIPKAKRFRRNRTSS